MSKILIYSDSNILKFCALCVKSNRLLYLIGASFLLELIVKIV